MSTFSRKILFGAGLVALALSCSRAPQELSKPQFDAGYSVGMDGVISDGVVISSSNNEQVIKREIRDQLYYTMGQLNAYNSVADLSRSTISLNEVNPLPGGLFEAHFAAKLFVSWPRQSAVPQPLILIMPAQMDLVSDFMTANVNCRDEFSHEAEVGNFWYYFRPEASGCPLRAGGVQGEDSLMVRRFGMTMTVSAENTSGKFPEYSKVWEDGQLVVTAMFGKEEAGAMEPSDAGISSFNAMYLGLRQAFGTPVSQSVNLPQGGVPGPRFDDVEMVFNTQRGPLKVAIMLLEGVRNMTPAQTQHYNLRTKDSDFVSYSGHSGLGANIRALARMGSFTANQYQIFFVNGCDTFAYVDNSLRDAHAAANPGFAGSKFFDIITNSMPSYFHLNSRGNISIISSLIGQQLTYRQILRQIDSSQMPVVTGEEDNQWPLAF